MIGNRQAKLFAHDLQNSRDESPPGAAEDHLLASYHYHLPGKLIAQRPLAERDSSRLMVLQRDDGPVAHRRFSDLPDILGGEHLLVINRTRVLPARLLAKRKSGAKVDILVLDPLGSGGNTVKALARGKLKEGEALILEDGTELMVAQRRGKYALLAFPEGETVPGVLKRLGHAPLPPYIKRESGPLKDDLESYQTVYAEDPGSVAAPTAGLHFTAELLEELNAHGVEVVEIVLHVGVGTFLPVTSVDVRDHRMEPEEYFIGPGAAASINRAKDAGKKVIAVGTTVVRALESSVDETGQVLPGRGETELFIYPGYEFRVIDGMLTNFHLPGSTLILMVSALAGRERLLGAYEEAVAQRYRFYSYGDAMLSI